MQSINLIVEDGTQPVGSNSYSSVADADAFHALRANEAWPQHTPEGEEPDPNMAAKVAALVKATDYLNSLDFYGRRAASGRVMAFPRLDCVDAEGFAITPDTVPDAVKQACCALAGLIYAGTDAQGTLERGGRVQGEGVGSLSTNFFTDAANRDVFAPVADLLAHLVPSLERFSGTGSNAPGKIFQGRVTL